jgi:hypothetical protein
MGRIANAARKVVRMAIDLTDNPHEAEQALYAAISLSKAIAQDSRNMSGRR